MLSVSKQKSEIAAVFNKIAPSYDFLNHLLSFGIDFSWRRRAIKMLPKLAESEVLDVACGTGDMAFELAKQGAKRVVGVDISSEMLRVAQEKKTQHHADKNIEFLEGDSVKIPFADSTFDAVTVAFGVRNFAHLHEGLSDIFRVMKSGATLLVLEFSMPQNWLMKTLYRFYFNVILPFVGGLISRNFSAYRYLPKSVAEFPSVAEFEKILAKVGFCEIQHKPLSFGIAQIYIAKKSKE